MCRAGSPTALKLQLLRTLLVSWKVLIACKVCEHFQKTKEHNDAGWLLLVCLGKVMNEKHELRDAIFQLQMCIITVKAKCAL